MRERRLVYLRDLLRELVLRDMKLRYKRSAIGVAWSLLNPLAQLLVFNLVFSFILPLKIQNYTVFLFSGLLAWNWFQSSLSAATGSIVENRDLVQQPGFPAMVLPIATITTHFIHYLMALPVLLIFMFIGGIRLHATIWLLPLVFAVQFLLTLSLAYPLAALQVVFRDIQYLLGVGLLLGFYLSPVFYDVSLLEQRYQVLLRLNPIHVLLDAYRSILIQGQVPANGGLITVLFLSFILLWLGYSVFRHARYRFAEEL